MENKRMKKYGLIFSPYFISLLNKNNKKTRPDKKNGFGGIERSRTAVRGFADLCLTTRPRYPFKGSKDRKKISLPK